MDEANNQKSQIPKHLTKKGLTPVLVFSTVLATLGTFHIGFNQSISLYSQNITKFIIEFDDEARVTSEYSANADFKYLLIVTISGILGYLLGICCSGPIANCLGRKRGLLINTGFGLSGGILLLIPYVTSVFASSFVILMLGHFLIEVNNGMYTILVPLYVAEISPIGIRGTLLIVTQLGIWMGSFVSGILQDEQILGTEKLWPVLLGIAIIPSVVHLILLPLCPESPRFLHITKKKEGKAASALQKLRGSDLVEDEIAEMRSEQLFEQLKLNNCSSTPVVKLCCSDLFKPLAIVALMKAAKGFSGYSTAMFLFPTVFLRSGWSINHIKYINNGISLMMLVATIVSMVLVDKKGRRKLQLYGLGGMFISSIFLSISMIAVPNIPWMSNLAAISILFFVVFYAVGPSYLPTIVTIELFTQGPRATVLVMAEVIYMLSTNIAAFLSSFFMIPSTFGAYWFVVISVLLANFWAISFRQLPETKRKTFEQNAATLGGRCQSRQNRTNSESRLSTTNRRPLTGALDGYRNTSV